MKKNKASSAVSSATYFEEACRFYENAKEILSKAKIEYNRRYMDAKPVQEASGMAYLAMFKAIDGFLIKNGVSSDNLPTSATEYQKALKKFSAHDGKVLAAFNIAYENLHIFGYYRRASGVKLIKEGFENAKIVIDKLSPI